MKRVRWAIAGLCLILGVSSAQAETRQWLRTFQDNGAFYSMESSSDGTQVYVMSNERLYRFSPSGSFLWMRTIPFVSRVLTVAPGGYVYVAGRGGLAKFTPSGVMVWWKQIGDLSGVAVNSTGSMVFGVGKTATSLLVRRMTPQGALVWTKTWRPAGANTADGGPTAIDPAGNIYVAGISDAASWKNFIVKVLPTGQFAWKKATSFRAYDLAYSGGFLYAAGGIVMPSYDHDTKTLVKLNAVTGSTAWSTHTQYPPLVFSYYTSVAARPKTGDLYVISYEDSATWPVWGTERFSNSGTRLWRVAAKGLGKDVATFSTGFYTAGMDFVNGIHKKYLARYSY